MNEAEKWEAMMFSCRRACCFTGQNFKAPEYLDWNAGRSYHKALWEDVKAFRKRRRIS